MAKTDSNLIPAVGYIRMSSDKQETSPKQQRAEIEKLAASKGYEIVAWYIDKGISGDEIEKRPDFRRMLDDAQRKQFRAILCWDQDRFGRFDSLKAGYVVEPLRMAGIKLVTVTQGEIDWTDFAGRMMYAIQQEGKNQFLVSLSQNTLRGRMQSAREGHGVTSPPLGYDRVFYDASGKLVHRAARADRFSKPREWRSRLDTSTNPDDLGALRLIFDRYANTDANLFTIAHELNKRGVPTKRGRIWDGPSVKVVLRNEAYLGRLVFGKSKKGRFNHVGNGKIGGDGRIVVENAHPALVDEATFRRVQEKLAKRAIVGRRSRSNAYVLSSLLICGHSGSTMCGGIGGNGVRYYLGSILHDGPGGPQSTFRIQQQPLEAVVVGHVVGLLSEPDITERLRASIARQIRKQPKATETARSIRTKLEALDQKVAKGAERLLLVDADNLADAAGVLSTWRAERQRLAAELATAEGSGRAQPGDQTTQVLAELSRLQEDFASADPDRVRAALKATIESITLFWVDNPSRRKWRRLERGVIQFRDKSVVALSRPMPATEFSEVLIAKKKGPSAGTPLDGSWLDRTYLANFVISPRKNTEAPAPGCVRRE